MFDIEDIIERAMKRVMGMSVGDLILLARNFNSEEGRMMQGIIAKIDVTRETSYEHDDWDEDNEERKTVDYNYISMASGEIAAYGEHSMDRVADLHHEFIVIEIENGLATGCVDYGYVSYHDAKSVHSDAD